MHPTYLNSIKSFEGFTPTAKWDYAQNSNGYGTRALFPGENISPEEAERRFNSEIASARSIVEKHAKGWDEGTKAALTSLTFNTGTRWIASGLGDAVRLNDIQGVRARFIEYNKAQGQLLPGLVNRRLAEADWIGRSAPVSNPASSPASSNGPSMESPAMKLPAAWDVPAGMASASLVSSMVAESVFKVSPQTLLPLEPPPWLDGSAAAPSASKQLSWSAFLALIFDMNMESVRPMKSDKSEPEQQSV